MWIIPPLWCEYGRDSRLAAAAFSTRHLRLYSTRDEQIFRVRVWTSERWIMSYSVCGGINLDGWVCRPSHGLCRRGIITDSWSRSRSAWSLSLSWSWRPVFVYFQSSRGRGGDVFVHGAPLTPEELIFSLNVVLTAAISNLSEPCTVLQRPREVTFFRASCGRWPVSSGLTIGGMGEERSVFVTALSGETPTYIPP